jgi:uncharacterized protein YidB (DUF937 family)
MGLLDVLNGMAHGPRGQREPSSAGTSSGMSPITMAVLGLLAYKAVKSLTGNQAGSSPGGAARTTIPASFPSGGIAAGVPGSASAGGLGGLLKGALGGVLAGGAAGNTLSSGLNDLLKQFQQSGQGDIASSWIGTGPNKTISPDDLAKVIGDERINSLAAHTGMSRDELLAGLSRVLPQIVDHLTPEGRLPNEQELSRML